MAADDLLINSATNAKVKFTPSGGGAEVTFPNANWAINETANVVLMVNGRDGVKRKKTYTDCPSIEVGVYKDEVDLVPGANIVVGQVGTLKCYFTDTKFRSCTVILQDIPDTAGSPGDAQMITLPFALESGTVTNGADS